MNEIPVIFTFGDIEYKGILSEISGAGAARGNCWHLYVNKFYWGQLHFLHGEFVFHSQLHHEEMKYLGDVFGEVVTLWYS